MKSSDIIKKNHLETPKHIGNFKLNNIGSRKLNVLKRKKTCNLKMKVQSQG